MAQDIDLGKISITPKGSWTNTVDVEYNDIWEYSGAKYLALKTVTVSTGDTPVTPSDDKVNWFKLSMEGLSAYELAVQKGYIGTLADWLVSLKQPAIDAAAVATAAVSSMNTRYLEKIDEVKTELESTVDNAVADRLARPVLISEKETKIGAYKIGGEDVDIYERTVKLSGLPQTVNETVDYIVSEEPLGYGLFFRVESFIASTGRSLTGSFFSSNYEIVNYSINNLLQSIVTVRCNTNVAQPVTGLLHMQYCKFYGDVIEIDVTLPEGVSKEAVALEIPPLKYNKKMAATIIVDDSYSTWNNLFSIINKRWVDNELLSFFNPSDNRSFFFHKDSTYTYNGTVYKKSSGFYPEKHLEFTDGLGISHRFPYDMAIWADKLTSRDYIAGWFNPYVTPPEIRQMMEFGCGIHYHDLTGYYSGISRDAFLTLLETDADYIKSMIDFMPKIMSQPNGDDAYTQHSWYSDIIQYLYGTTNQAGNTYIYPFRFPAQNTWDKSERILIKRGFLEVAYPTFQSFIDAITQDLGKPETERIWRIIGLHRPTSGVRNCLVDIENLYGKSGTDEVWMTSMDEMLEYTFMRNNSTVIKNITQTGIKYKVYVPMRPASIFRSLTFKLNGISSAEGITVNSSDNCIGRSYGMVNDSFLLNLNFDKNYLSKVEKYVSQFEADYNGEYRYDDASYFVQHLRPGLREMYQQRLDVWTSSPTFATFAISGGVESTKNPVVILNLVYTGQAPTHYMASERSDFSGAEWNAYALNPSFTLSGTFNETKTVYVRLKNAYGISGTLSDTIMLLEPDLSLLSIVINNGAISTSVSPVTIDFSYTGFPSHYMASENVNFTGAVWEEFSPSVQFALSAGYGSKTIYAKLKKGEDQSNVTQAVSSSIEKVDPNSIILNSFLINAGNGYTGSRNVVLSPSFTNIPTHYRIGESSDLSASPWVPYTSGNINYTLSASYGAKTLYLQLKNSYNESEVKNASINYLQSVALSAVILAGGADVFEGTLVPVALTVSGGTPTHYMASESSSFAGASWLDFAATFNYNFGSTGDKTLYVKVKNQISESSVMSDSVNVTVAPPKTIVWNADSSFTAPMFEYPEVNGMTTNKTLFTQSTSLQDVILKSIDGVDSNIKLRKNNSRYPIDDDSTSTGMGMDYSSTRQPVLSGNAGDYADSLIANYRHVNNPPTVPGRVKFLFPAGNYRMKLLMSTSTTTSLSGYLEHCLYRLKVGSTYLDAVQVGPSGFTGVNNNAVNAEISFAVPANDTEVTLLIYNNYSSTPRLLYRPGINLVEITKLS